MQLRISPGGRTSNSRRSRPELPPSSVTVTMAVISSAGTAGSPAFPKSLSPCSSAESPVPPPIETTRSGEVSQRRILAERHHAVAHIARRQHVEFAAQPAGAAAVVGDRDDGGDFERRNRRVEI